MPGSTVGQIALELTLDKAGFASDMTSVLGTAKSAGSSLAKIFQNTSKAASSSVTKAIGGVTNQLQSMAKKAVGLVAAAFSTREIVNFSKACIELGSDLAEVQNVVDVTFGSSAKTINEFAKDAAESFGLSELSAKRYASTIGAMFKSMGIAGDQVTEMSQKMAELAGDMASFYNLDTDEAFSKIRSGIAGVTMPLQQLGISLSQANLEAYALANGFGTAYSKMSQAEQALVRYNYLLHVTSDAQGDFARTSQSWANQIRILQLRFEQLKATIGQGLINALTPVVRVINLILAKLQRLAEAFKNFTAYIFGNAGSSSVSSTTESIASSLGNASTGAAGLADGMKDTADAAKTALRYLAPFDELNVLNTNPATGGGGGSALGDLSDLLDDAGTTFGDGMSDLMDSIEIKPTAFTEAVKRAIEEGNWYEVGALFASKLNEQVQKWNAYGDGLTFGTKIKNALEALNGFLDEFEFYDLGAQIGNWLGGFFDGVTPEYITSTIVNIINKAVSGASGLIDSLKAHNVPGKIGQAIGTAFATFDWDGYINLKKKIMLGIVDIINNATSSFIANGGKEALIDAGEDMGAAIGEAFAAVEWKDVGEVVSSVFTGLVKLVSAAISSFVELGGADELIDACKTIGEGIGEALAGVEWGNVGTAIGAVFEGLVGLITSAISSFVELGGPAKLRSAMGTIGEAIGTAFANIRGMDLAAIINAISGGIKDFLLKGINAFSVGGGWKEVGELFQNLKWGNLFALTLPLLTIKILDLAVHGLTTALLVKKIAQGFGIFGTGGAGAAAGIGTAIEWGAAGLVIAATIKATWEWITDPDPDKPAPFDAEGWYNLASGNNTIVRQMASAMDLSAHDAFLIANPGYANALAAQEEVLKNQPANVVAPETAEYYSSVTQTLDDMYSEITSPDKNLFKQILTGFKVFFTTDWGEIIDDAIPEAEVAIYEAVTGKTSLGERIRGAGGGGGGLLHNEMLWHSASIPLELDPSKVVEAVDRSDLPSRIEQLANKTGNAMKRGLDATNIPGKFLETTLASVAEFGKGDYNGSGKKAGDGIKTGAHNTNIPGKFNELATLSLNEFTKRDFSSGGRNAGDTIKNGFNASNVVAAVSAAAATAMNAFKSANWASIGAAAGNTIGAHLKAGVAAAANSAVTVTAYGRKPETIARIAVMANGGFVQGGLFLAGEVPGQAEMIGDINGKTGVASGQEITGIGEAIYSTSEEERRLLQDLIGLGQALLAKDPFGKPNSAAGRWIAKSQQAYKAVTG